MKRRQGADKRAAGLGFGPVVLIALCLIGLATALRSGLSSDRVVVAAVGPRLGTAASPLLTPTVLDAAIVRTAAVPSPTAPTATTPASDTIVAPPAGAPSTVATSLTAVTASLPVVVAATSTTATSSTTSTSAVSSTAVSTSATSTASTSSTTAVGSTTSATSAVSTSTTSVATSSTSTGVTRSVDLSVSAAFVGPLVEGRAAFVSVTVANAGPDTAWAPRVTVELPSGFSEVSSVDPAWSCSVTATTATCGGSLLDVGASSVWMLRGTLRGDVVLQSSITKSAAVQAAPGAVRFEVADASGGTDRQTESNVFSLPFGPIATGGLASLDVRTLRGGLAVAANSLLTCDRAEPSCAAGLASGDNADARVAPANSLATAVPGTTASSSATLSLRDGATVAQAWLVWGAVSLNGSPLPRTNLGTAWLSTPSSPAELVTPTLFQTTGANDFYARADVTSRMRAATAGSFGFGLVGGLAGLSGTNQSAGWALVVLYAHPAEPKRMILVMDGLQVMGGGPATTLALGSFATAAGSAAADQAALIAFDGDRGQADLACVNGVRLGDAANPTTASASCDQLFPTDDIFNATVSVDGVARQSTETGSSTFLGLDADVFAASFPRSAASSLVVKATADVVRIGFFALAFSA